MASKRAAIPAKYLFNGFRAYNNVGHSFQPVLTRSMATEAPLPSATLSKSYADANLSSMPTQPILEDNVDITSSDPPAPSSSRGPYIPPTNPFLSTTSTTLYSFPSLEPTSFAYYPSTHLLVPTRKDILHRAVIFEGDATRQGTASTKWRSEVHGSNRKIRPQKGTGSARLGDKKSPMLRGGGVAFGPKPRDFSTELQRKVYDMAWRMALSYRYKKGELLVLESRLEIPGVHKDSMERYLRDILSWNGLGKAGGRTTFVSTKRRAAFFGALEGEGMKKQARAFDMETVDVKHLLTGARLVVERSALDMMLKSHESDLPTSSRLNAWRHSSHTNSTSSVVQA